MPNFECIVVKELKSDFVIDDYVVLVNNEDIVVIRLAEL